MSGRVAGGRVAALGRIAVVGASPERAALLAAVVRAAGLPVLESSRGSELRGVAASILDLSGTAPDEVVDAMAALAGPVLAVAGSGDLPALRVALAAGAADVAVDAGPEELALRLRKVLDDAPGPLLLPAAEARDELLEANRELRELARRRMELVGMCAHDLRQPLQALRANVQLLLANHLTEGRSRIEAIGALAVRMGQLVEDLLDFQAIDAGRLQLHAGPVEAGRLATEACAAAAVLAQERAVILCCPQGGPGPTVTADSSKLHEALGNLLGNAIRASPPGGVVELTVAPQPGGGVRLSVRDQGEGLSAEQLADVLSGDGRPWAARGEGRGLGLAIVRAVAALHGGRLHARSAPGEGSTFHIELPPAPGAVGPPLEERQPAPFPAESGEPLTAAARTASVLLVEDDAELRQLLVRLLEDRYEVREAATGEEGLRRARESTPDLVVLDLFLPGLDGFGVLDELRSAAATADVPVLLLSGEGDELLRVQGLRRGASDFVQKPFSTPELRARIDRLLQAHRAREQLRALAQEDALTGLANFRAFQGRLEEEVKRARRYRTPLSAVMVDLDELKTINDLLGHGAGNEAIVALSFAIRSQLRETDFAARFGGDEFVLLLPHTGAGEARILAERLRQQLRTVRVAGTHPLRASFGVAALPEHAEVLSGTGALSPPPDGEALIRAADRALYRAKRAGRDRVCVAEEEGGTTGPAVESGDEAVRR